MHLELIFWLFKCCTINESTCVKITNHTIYIYTPNVSKHACTKAILISINNMDLPFSFFSGDVTLYFTEYMWHSSSRPAAKMWFLPSYTLQPFIIDFVPVSCLQMLPATAWSDRNFTSYTSCNEMASFCHSDIFCCSLLALVATISKSTRRELKLYVSFNGTKLPWAGVKCSCQSMRNLYCMASELIILVMWLSQCEHDQPFEGWLQQVTITGKCY